MKAIIKQIKADLKKKAEYIRFLKHIRKEHFEDERPKNLQEQWNIQYELDSKKQEFRHKHLAYCMLRGTSYESIECPAEGNEPDMGLVEKLQDEWKEKYEKTLCHSA